MKKTRKKSHRAVRRTPKTAQRLYRDLKKQMRDTVLRSKWDNHQSLQGNFDKFTIQDFEHRLADDEELLRPSEAKGLNEQQLIIMQKLFAKYADDCENMARDTKINVFQWTAARCRKLLGLYTQQAVCASANRHLLPKLTLAPTRAHEELLEQYQARAQDEKRAAEADIQAEIERRLGTTNSQVAKPQSGSRRSQPDEVHNKKRKLRTLSSCEAERSAGKQPPRGMSFVKNK
ncbi:ribosome biogenesis protein nop16 [Cystoisospora suis]|uniref:Ribosome biogenesis protein nop16 n=1 Tax=Cystoisospora suis TaxID=483139 RepID=A0A2C6KCL7_9APIC|nr:ribosome biogenesis protein nop16 [Cystoisospora suis]